MMVCTRSCWLIAIVALLNFSTVAAQSADDPGGDMRYWVHAGLSLTTLGTGVVGGLAVEANRHVFSLRAASTDPAWGGGTWDVAFLYGRMVEGASFMLSGGTGVAVVGGSRYGHLFGDGPVRTLEPMIGFPLEAQLAWTPTGIVALGVHGFANVNTGQPFGGIGLSLRVGDLR